MRVMGLSWFDRLSRVVACASLVLLPVVAQAAEEDPWEGFNRAVFRFNDTLDTYALKPLAQGYQAVTPQFFEDGVHNVFGNIGDVGNLANNLLQGKVHDAGVDTSRTQPSSCSTRRPRSACQQVSGAGQGRQV